MQTNELKTVKFALDFSDLITHLLAQAWRESPKLATSLLWPRICNICSASSNFVSDHLVLVAFIAAFFSLFRKANQFISVNERFILKIFFVSVIKLSNLE